MRIGIIVRALVMRSPTSGIYNSVLGWSQDFKSWGHYVDVILDSPNFYPELSEVGRIFTPENPLSYSRHTEVFQFEDGFNFERCLNFRDSLIKALTSNIYDVLICSEPESALLAWQMGLHKLMRVVYYTHEPGTFFKNGNYDIYRPEYFELVSKIVEFPIYFGVPSQLNRWDFGNENSRSLVLPLPIPDASGYLKDISIGKQEGVLFNGRIEQRKNFDFFVKTLVNYRETYGVELPAKVLTKETHIKKAEEQFSKYNYTNFEVRTNLTLSEKTKFIRSAKVGFHPAIQESFGLAAFESLRWHPTILLEEYQWYANFKGFKNLRLATKGTVLEILHEVISETRGKVSGRLDFQKYFQDYEIAWKNFLELPLEPKKVAAKSSTISQYLEEFGGQWHSLSHYYQQTNSKKCFYLVSDIFPLYSGTVKVYQTSEKSFIGNSEAHEVAEEIQKPIESVLTLF